MEDFERKFILAAARGHTFLLKRYIKAGVGINAVHKHKYSRGTTAINIAAYCGRKGAVKYLLTQNPDLEISDTEEDTPLTSAVKAGHFEIAQILLDAGANPAHTNQDGLCVQKMVGQG